jgi:RimJ/RimL family protein N-acetyltransferase
MIYLRELESKFISENYLSSMKDLDSLKFTGARFLDWDYEKILQYLEQNFSSESSKLLGVYDSDEHIGNVRIHSIDLRNSTCELGIMIFGTGRRGQGYGTEAIRLAKSYVNQELKISRLMADYFEENIASERIFEKNGFVKEGKFLKHFLNLDGTFSNSIRVAINFKERY